MKNGQITLQESLTKIYKVKKQNEKKIDILLFIPEHRCYTQSKIGE